MPCQLQALCDTLHMQLSVMKTRFMVISPAPSFPATLTCNGQQIEEVQILKYLGLHFHTSGNIFHLMIIRPVKAKAAGSWAVVQRWRKHLQCGNTVHLELQLLQNIIVLSVHYGCELYGMHSPRLQWLTRHALSWNSSMLDLHFALCRIRLNPPSAKLLTELGLSPLKVFCWR